MTMTSWLLLLCLVSDIIDIGGVGATAYDAFGVLDPWNKKLQLPQLKRSLPDARNIVFLTGDAAASEGDVFAFTARIYLRQPIFFQIWRLVGETGQKKKFKLIAQREVMPSVTEELHQHEDFYLLGDHCIHVLPGDRLGLMFNERDAAVYYGQETFYDKSEVSTFPTVGSDLDFLHDLQLVFVATGFIYVNSNTTGNVTVTCPKGLKVDGTVFHIDQPTTTTYRPPTGVPGMTGSTGQTGATGHAGVIGVKGDVGMKGFTGEVGNTGHTGPTGPMGANNTFKGDVGTTGENGSRGQDGADGSRGSQGVVGEPGPQGFAGTNYTVYLYGPYRYNPDTDDEKAMSGDRWWAGSMAMTVVYILLAVTSILLLLTLVFLIIICCQCTAVQRALKKHSDI